jgi:hypothetical protein
MRAIRISLTSVLAIGTLVVSVAAGVAAQDDSARFEWSATPGEEEGTATIEATDSRASGALTIGLGEFLVTDDLLLGTSSLRLVNDDGAWTGTVRGFGGGGETQSVDIWELTGEGGYDGLRLFMFDHAGSEQPWGIIVPDAAIPPVPDLPAE